MRKQLQCQLLFLQIIILQVVLKYQYGALKDNKAATIVGDKTFGKGVIQDLIYLSNGGAIKITSAEYYTPNRNKINEVGIEPDYNIAYDYTNMKVDDQLQKAIEILKEK